MEHEEADMKTAGTAPVDKEDARESQYGGKTIGVALALTGLGFLVLEGIVCFFSQRTDPWHGYLWFALVVLLGVTVLLITTFRSSLCIWSASFLRNALGLLYAAQVFMALIFAAGLWSVGQDTVGRSRSYCHCGLFHRRTYPLPRPTVSRCCRQCDRIDERDPAIAASRALARSCRLAVLRSPHRTGLRMVLCFFFHVLSDDEVLPLLVSRARRPQWKNSEGLRRRVDGTAVPALRHPRRRPSCLATP